MTNKPIKKSWREWLINGNPLQKATITLKWDPASPDEDTTMSFSASFNKLTGLSQLDFLQDCIFDLSAIYDGAVMELEDLHAREMEQRKNVIPFERIKKT